MRYFIPWVTFLFFACQPKEQQSFEYYVPLVFQDSITQQIVEEQMPTRPIAVELNNWQFAVGNPTSGLITKTIPNPDSIVQTPHRINLPNTPMWYMKTIALDSSKLLLVKADDGAQTFYNGTQLKQVLPNIFELKASSEPVQLAIRVLNNALKGGLRKAELVDAQEGKNYFNKVEATQLVHSRYDSIINLLYNAPFVQRVNAGSYLVKVSAKDTNDLKLKYNTDAIATSTRVEQTFTFELPNLSSDTVYNYFLAQKEVVSKNYQLKTDDTTLPFSFTAWGDSQGGWRTFKQLTQLMYEDDPDFSIGLGDLVANGSEPSQWLDFLYAIQPLAASIPIYLVIGNHDYDGYYDDLIPRFYKQYIRADTYFAWTYNNCRFIALDPNEVFPLGIKGEQRTWFFKQINSDEWKNAKWRFILLHQPPYSQGWPDYHGDDFIRVLIDEHAESAGIDFVLSGHSHCYERLTKQYGKQTTHFIILGGAGGGLEPPQSSAYPKMDTVIKVHNYGRFEVFEDSIEFEVLGLKNSILDRINFKK